MWEFTGGCDFKGVEITQVWLKDKRYKGGGIAKRRKPSLPPSSFFCTMAHIRALISDPSDGGKIAPMHVQLRTQGDEGASMLEHVHVRHVWVVRRVECVCWCGGVL